MKKVLRCFFIIFCLMIFIHFASEIIVSITGGDWFSSRFYRLRCMGDLGILGVMLYLLIKYIIKYFDTDDMAKVKLNLIIGIIVASLFILTDIYDIFRRNWFEPRNYTINSLLLSGGLWFFTIYLLGIIPLHKSEMKKSSYIATSIVILLTLYTTFCSVVYVIMEF